MGKKYIIVVICICVIGIPLIVYLLSVIPIFPSGTNNDWAGFWGGYIGAIIGGFCTVVGVYWTIAYMQKNYEEDVRNRSLPYMALTTLVCDRGTDLFHLSDDIMHIESTRTDYKEHRLEEVYVIIEDGESTYQKSLPEKDKLLLKNGGLEKASTKDGVFVIRDRGMISIPIEFENVGNGAALSFRLGLNREDCKEPTYILPLNIKVGDKFYIHIYSTDNTENDVNHGKYNLEIFYKDIFQNEYCQKYEFILWKDEEKNRAEYSLQLEGKQIKMWRH